MVPGSPVITTIRASSSTLEEEPLASSERAIRAEVETPEKMIESPLEPPALQQTLERSDDSFTATMTDRPKLSPAHVRREVEMVVERRQTPQQSSVVERRQTPPRSMVVERREAPPRNMVVERRQTPQQSAPLSPALLAPQTRHPESRHQAALSRSEEHETPVRESAPPPRSVESPSQNTSPVGREKMDERYVERVVVERLLPVESSRILKPPEIDSEAAKPLRPPAPSGVVAQPQVIRYSEPKATARAEAPPGQEPAPTINVTIGRIEVRAVAPDPSARERRQSASQTRMSLSDYLQRRAGGGVR